MPQTCTVCRHPDRAAIDRAIVAGEALRNIAERVSLSVTALHRHKSDHLPAALVAAKAADDTGRALDVIGQLQTINRVAFGILKEARDARDGATALKAIDRIQKQIELQAKLLGDLDERPVVNVLLTPEWATVRAVIVEALAPYRDARIAVAERLATVEASNGHR
jgi:hypothetical protein